jgi:large subunit ribosomal protein L4
MLVDVYSQDGKKSGQVDLPDSVFNVEPHEHAMYLAVKSYLAHQRQGTHKTKERWEVSGGGKKPWKQKGRGTARSGSSRSPVWVGGGTVFGPRPHKYRVELTKKMRRLARKSAFSLRARENAIVIVEDMNLSSIKTKQVATVLKNLGLSGEKVLQLIPTSNDTVLLSSRNIEKLTTMIADKVSAYHVLSSKKILLHRSAVDTIVNSFEA